METTTQYLYTQSYHHFPSAPSPPPTADLRRFRHHHNVRHRPNLTMPLRDLTLRRIAANQNCFRFNQATESFRVAKRYASINHRAMAEEKKNTEVSQGKAGTTSLSVSKTTEEKDKSSDNSTPALSSPPPPPPPEKPLPGDCCGSGCVRCVWDVYYEELEEYNKLCDSKIS